MKRKRTAPPRMPRGYVRGIAAAADYLDMDERTFRENVMPHVKPRLFADGGHPWFSIRSLDAFMDPARTPDGATTAFYRRQNVSVSATVSV